MRTTSPDRWEPQRLDDAPDLRALVAGRVAHARSRFVGWDATGCNPRATSGRGRRMENRAKCCGISGEPGGNRTHNPQIKSLLLCQLSYRPEGEA